MFRLHPRFYLSYFQLSIYLLIEIEKKGKKKKGKKKMKKKRKYTKKEGKQKK